MHSCEAATSAASSAAPQTPMAAPAPLTGPQLLTQLGRLMVRAGSPSRSQRDGLLQAKLRQASGSRCDYDALVSSQPKPRESAQDEQHLERQLEQHVQALWSEQIPVCIEVVLAPECMACYKALSGLEPEAAFNKGVEPRGLLVERWTIAVAFKKSHETHMFSTSQWLLNAVRSQLHFSQVSAWLARLSTPPRADARRELAHERRRKLSHEKCNIKKLESNCDEQESIPSDNPTTKTLNLVYSIKIPGETYKISDFNRTPTIHTFPLTEIDHKRYLKVSLESLPRTDTIPTAKCFCNQPQKRRPSKDIPKAIQDDITSKLNDLRLNPPIANYNYHPSYSNIPQNYDSKVKNVLDDRMHTPCSENGKHKCNCDDESDNQKSSNNNSEHKLHEKRIKDIAKHKRRVRKEIRLRDSSSDYSGTSEGDSIKNKETHTSIPILQASRFDRFKAIGCYRNQTYLTLPATRIETKSPFMNDNIDITSIDKRTNTIATQTDDILCFCGSKMYLKCDGCDKKMVRSDAQYNLASMVENGHIKTTFDAKNVNEEAIKRTCDIISNKNSVSDVFINNNDNLKCDNVSFNVSTVRKRSDDDEVSNIIKRPKLKKLFPIVDRIEKIVSDRFVVNDKPNFELTDKESDITFPYPKHDVEMRQISFSKDNADLFGQTEKRNELNFYEHRCFKDLTAKQTNSDKGKSLQKVTGQHDKKETNINPDKVLNKPYFLLKPNQELKQIEPTDVSGINDMKDLNLKDTDSVFDRPVKTEKRSKHPSVTEEYVLYEKNYYGTIDRNDNIDSPKDENQPGFEFPEKCDTDLTKTVNPADDSIDVSVPTASDVDKFRWRLDSAASMVFHTKTGLPLTSSPAPLKRASNCFDFDDSINGVSGIKSALFNPEQAPETPVSPRVTSPRPNRTASTLYKPKCRPPSGLLGTFEESALKGRLEAASTVAGFTARLGAYGSFCPPQKRLPVTVFFYALGGNNAPYMGHINLGSSGYQVPRSGTIQVSLFNPHGTLVKMFVVVYSLESMPRGATTFLRQRTLYLPAGAPQPDHRDLHKYLRYSIHLRFMTSKSGKLYLHTDIRIIVSRKADFDAATAHAAILSNKQPTNHSAGSTEHKMADRGTNKPCRVFGGASEGDFELGYENQNEVGYELRSFTYGPDNPKFSPC